MAATVSAATAAAPAPGPVTTCIPVAARVALWESPDTAHAERVALWWAMGPAPRILFWSLLSRSARRLWLRELTPGEIVRMWAARRPPQQGVA